MQYVAAVSGKGRDIDRVKEQLLQSNPVLEGQSYHCRVACDVSVMTYMYNCVCCFSAHNPDAQCNIVHMYVHT